MTVAGNHRKKREARLTLPLVALNDPPGFPRPNRKPTVGGGTAAEASRPQLPASSW